MAAALVLYIINAYRLYNLKFKALSELNNVSLESKKAL